MCLVSTTYCPSGIHNVRAYGGKGASKFIFPRGLKRSVWWRILWVLSYEKLYWVGVTLVAVTHPA